MRLFKDLQPGCMEPMHVMNRYANNCKKNCLAIYQVATHTAVCSYCYATYDGPKPGKVCSFKLLLVACCMVSI